MNISGQAFYLEMDPLTDADIASEKQSLHRSVGAVNAKRNCLTKTLFLILNVVRKRNLTSITCT